MQKGDSEKALLVDQRVPGDVEEVLIRHRVCCVRAQKVSTYRRGSLPHDTHALPVRELGKARRKGRQEEAKVHVRFRYLEFLKGALNLAHHGCVGVNVSDQDPVALLHLALDETLHEPDG